VGNKETMGITIPGANAASSRPYYYWSDGTDQYREGIRSGVLYTDKLLPGGTWEQAEDVGWEVVRSVQ